MDSKMNYEVRWKISQIQRWFCPSHFFLIVSHISFLPPHQVNPWSHGKCVGVLAAVGDVKAPSPLFHCLTCIE